MNKYSIHKNFAVVITDGKVYRADFEMNGNRMHVFEASSQNGPGSKYFRRYTMERNSKLLTKLEDIINA